MSRSFTFTGRRSGSGEIIGEWQTGDAPLVVLPRGSIVDGRYEVVDYLGSGASASVYKCTDTMIGNLSVALKLIPSSLVDSQIAVKRLQRELMANYDFDHPNIARFYECVRGENFIGLVMEYVPGGSLADLFDSGKRFSAEEVRNILIQIANALEVIHAAGVVHRDLKLENILFSESGMIKVTDFGLARDVTHSDDHSSGKIDVDKLDPNLTNRNETITNGIAGSPLYLAPEYISTTQVTHLSDIYALGVIGYQLLTGTEPYPSSDIMDMFRAKLSEPPVSPLQIRPDCSPSLAAIVERAMAIDPKDRFKDAWHLRAALENVQSSSGTVLMTEAYKTQVVSMLGVDSDDHVTLTLVGGNYSNNVQKVVDFFGKFGLLGYLLFAAVLSLVAFSLLYIVLELMKGNEPVSYLISLVSAL